MANATRKTIEKTVTEELIVLELTQEEAFGLRAVLMDFDGDFENYSGNVWSLVDVIGNPAESDNRPIRVGDRVRILVDGAEYANVSKGDVLLVVKVRWDSIETEDNWVFFESSSYERVND